MVKYFDEITRNDGHEAGKYCFGVIDTMNALESGAVDILIVWENLDIERYSMRNGATVEDIVKHLDPRQKKDKTNFVDADTGVELEIVDQLPLLEWLANKYKDFGATLEIVTDRSQEGAQFVRGFGGIGGILRYPFNFSNFEVEEYDDDDFDLDDY